MTMTVEALQARRAARGMSDPLNVLRAYGDAHASEAITAVEACACVPALVCGSCRARGYSSGLAGYAARIYPAQCTPADDAREARVHYVAPEADELAPWDTCSNCGSPVIDRAGSLVTMATGNGECYGTRYRPQS